MDKMTIKRIIFYFSVLIVTLLGYNSFAATDKPKKQHILKPIIRNLKEVELFPQTSKDLCWAASMKMILNYLKNKSDSQYSLEQIATKSIEAKKVYTRCNFFG